MILRSRADKCAKIEECFVVTVRIGVLCSMESPTERKEMRDVVDVVAQLLALRRFFLVSGFDILVKAHMLLWIAQSVFPKIFMGKSSCKI